MYFLIVQNCKVVNLKKRSISFPKKMNGNHIVYSLGSNICENHFLQNHAMKDFGVFADF